MSYTPIPSLYSATVFGRGWKTTQLEGSLIPRNFSAYFEFEDEPKKSLWNAIFDIQITELGTPSITGIQMLGSYLVADHFLLNFPQKYIINGELPMHWPESLDDEIEYLIEKPTRGNITRGMIKILEQHRFNLFELALTLAITQMEPVDWGRDTIWKLNSRTIPEAEMRNTRRKVETRVRQKVTLDFLKEVADLYNEVGQKNGKPIEAIMEKYNCSHRTASEYATKARREKLLPSTRPGKVTVRKPTDRKGKSNEKK